MSLKKLKEGEKFPSDFWNYNINPILGYEYYKTPYHTVRDEKKYCKVTQPLK